MTYSTRIKPSLFLSLYARHKIAFFRDEVRGFSDQKKHDQATLNKRLHAFRERNRLAPFPSMQFEDHFRPVVKDVVKKDLDCRNLPGGLGPSRQADATNDIQLTSIDGREYSLFVKGRADSKPERRGPRFR
jgi:hypothetical protein